MKLKNKKEKNNRVLILGLDIGGANTKAALLHFQNSELLDSFSYIEYFPFWEKTKHQIDNLFNRIGSHLFSDINFKIDDVEYIAITMTAELSDAFQTKKEGVEMIIDALCRKFEKHKLRFISTKNSFLEWKEARENYLLIAAANWVSTSLFLGKYISDCILIDAGSTTIDLIPIIESIPTPLGKTDLDRLLNHELIYTGGLRATIPSITQFVPYKGHRVRISFEKFALISDVHRILGNISEKEYLNDTADSRSKSKEDCYARLARVICMDQNTISTNELDNIARFIYQKQLELIKEELDIFFENVKLRYPQFKGKPLFVITGLSADFLIKKILKEMGFKNIKYYEEITNIPNHISSSAFAVAGALYFQINQ
jgi:hypothetical protein